MDPLNLTKGEKVDLTKTNPGLKKVAAGLGWDVKVGAGPQLDLDAFAIQLKAGKFTDNKNLIFFRNLTGEGIAHSGDNLTGQGDGDDETITIDLDKVQTEEIMVGVNIFEADKRKQNFGQVNKAFIRLYDAETKKELAKYDLSEDFSGNTGVMLGKLYKHENEWKFQALGEGKNGDLNQITTTYR